MNANLLIILIVALVGNILIASTLGHPRFSGVVWTIGQIITITILWGAYTILTA